MTKGAKNLVCRTYIVNLSLQVLSKEEQVNLQAQQLLERDKHLGAKQQLVMRQEQGLRAQEEAMQRQRAALQADQELMSQQVLFFCSVGVINLRVACDDQETADCFLKNSLTGGGNQEKGTGTPGS